MSDTHVDNPVSVDSQSGLYSGEPFEAESSTSGVTDTIQFHSCSLTAY